MTVPARTPKSPKKRVKNPRLMAFSFTPETLPEDAGWLNVSVCAWNPEARRLLELLSAQQRAAGQKFARLPYRDLRQRLHVRDRQILRTADDVGTGYRKGAAGQAVVMLYSRSRAPRAQEEANAAAAIWAGRILGKTASLQQDTVQALENLALSGKAVRATEQSTPVYEWDHNRQTGTARKPRGSQLYAALADYVGLHLEGKVIYPEAGRMYRVLSDDLGTGEVQLMTAPISLTLPVKKEGAGVELRFSLGITISTETYPGRRLPVLQVSHTKHVWAREPEKGTSMLSGYFFPAEETRVLPFSVEKDLTMGEDYAAIASEYTLPTLTTAQIAQTGTGGSRRWKGHQVVINHRFGRGEKNTALRGVPVLDQLRSFEALIPLLSEIGLTPWTALEEIPTFYKDKNDSDMAWNKAFEEPEQDSDEPDSMEEEGESSEKDPKAAKRAETARLKKEQDKTAAINEWTKRMTANIDLHYGGSHHIMLAYGEGLRDDAAAARDVLLTLLGDHAIIELRALPPGVHGPAAQGSDHKTLGVTERADLRAQAWLPFTQDLRTYMNEHAGQPLSGLLVMADLWYADPVTGRSKRDDKINKRVARSTINRDLGLLVQYLLPRDRLPTGELGTDHIHNFRMRVTNAWRDLAWKNLGKINRMEEKITRSFNQPPEDPAALTLLGIGIIRVNRKKYQGNNTSFIPYAIELDPVTGTCQGSVLLNSGDGGPETTHMAPLKEVVRMLSTHGPSYLARGTKEEIAEKRRKHTQAFIHQTISSRAALHPGLIVLLDGSTLSGMWPWLADESIDPNSVKLGDDVNAHIDFQHASLIRIRHHHAPKILKDGDTHFMDGDTVRTGVTWSNADLFRLTDTGTVMETYLNFGSRILQYRRSISTYLDTVDEQGVVRPPRNTGWQTPSAIEISIIRKGPHEPVELAKFVEALRSDYAHFGNWINSPGPLHFASLLKEYVPDYVLAELEAPEGDEEQDAQPGLDFAPFNPGTTLPPRVKAAPAAKKSKAPTEDQPSLF